MRKLAGCICTGFYFYFYPIKKKRFNLQLVQEDRCDFNDDADYMSLAKNIQSNLPAMYNTEAAFLF